MRNYNTVPYAPQARNPGAASSSKPAFLSRSPSPSLSEALRGLGQGGATRSQILRGPVTDGFVKPIPPVPKLRLQTGPAKAPGNAGTSRPRAEAEAEAAAGAEAGAEAGPEPEPERGRQMHRQQGPFPRNNPLVVANVEADDDSDTHVHTVNPEVTQHEVPRKGLPPFAQGVPSRGIFSKTRGHYEYTDTARMLPIAKVPNRKPVGSKMSDTSGKEERVERVERAGGIFPGEKGAGVSAAAVPLTKKQKVARHLKKWWWAHALVFIAITILSVCLTIFIGIPRIAQARVNQAVLTIQGISLSQTQATNYTLAINSTIQADDTIHAVIDPFEGVMYLEDWPPQTPFARIQFPSVTSASKSVVNVTQLTQILDMDAFTVFNDWFIVNKTVRVTVEGDSHLSVNAVNRKYPVHFKKTIEMNALGNLDGTTVPTSQVLLQPDANGNNFLGTAVIPNRSFITFELGNTSFINYMIGANGTAQNVGTVFMDNLTIAPGNHSYPLRGTVSQVPVLQEIQQRPYCETGNIPFLLQGLNVTNHGQYLSYFTESLAATNQSVEIPIKPDLEALGLTINCSN